jgi:hypothetical protein
MEIGRDCRAARLMPVDKVRLQSLRYMVPVPGWLVFNVFCLRCSLSASIPSITPQVQQPGGQQLGTQAPPAAAKTVLKAIAVKQVILRKHFDLLYWWAVWLYAGIAAALTYTAGETVTIGGKAVKMYPEPWLAIGFLAVILFVAIFTSLRARGALSMVLVMGLMGAAVAVQYLLTWRYVFELFPLLRLHINLGFYVATVVVLFPVWLATTFFFNRLQQYRFRPGRQVSSIKMFGGGETNIASHTLSMHMLDHDIFVHRVLGLWPLLGTGDIEVGYTKPDGSAHKEIIHNVVRPHAKMRDIQEMMK